MKIENQPVVVLDNGEGLSPGCSDAIMKLMEKLQNAHIISTQTGISAQAALRIVETIAQNPEEVLRILGYFEGDKEN